MSNDRDPLSGQSGKSASGTSEAGTSEADKLEADKPKAREPKADKPKADKPKADKPGDSPPNQKAAACAAEKMGDPARRLIGVWIVTLSAVALGHLAWAWSLAVQIANAKPKFQVHAYWLGIEFAPQKSSVLLMVVVLTALIGSAATIGLTFAERAGYHKLEKGWEWWYITRPLTAASIGVLAFALLQAGFFGNATSNTSDLLAAAATGGLAGLFTDQLLQKMRTALGLSAFGESANDDSAKIQSNAKSPAPSKGGS
jgi:hypothetical protein